MRNRTWKIRNFGEVAAAVAKAPSLRAAASELGLNVSTISRLVKAGKVPDPRGRARVKGAASGVAPAPLPAETLLDPETHPDLIAWAQDRYFLNAAELQAVRMLQKTRDMVFDPSQTPATQLNAMREFRSLLKQLNLPNEAQTDHGDTQGTIRPFPQRAG